MDQRAQHDGAVHHAAGDDDVGAGIQRLGNGEGAEIGIAGQHIVGERRAGEHVLQAPLTQLLDPADQLVTGHGGDLQRKPLGGDPRFHGAG